MTSDMSYYSDAEVEDRLSHNRSRSLTGNYVLYSPDNQGRLARYDHMFIIPPAFMLRGI